MWINICGRCDTANSLYPTSNLALWECGLCGYQVDRPIAENCSCGGYKAVINKEQGLHRPDCMIGSKEFWESFVGKQYKKESKMGSSSLKNPSHKRCLICEGIRECPEDCEVGDQHAWCDCVVLDKEDVGPILCGECASYHYADEQHSGLHRPKYDKPLTTKSPPTAREALYTLHRDLSAASLELMQKKNHDYASEDDPYRNFRTFGELGILVRLSDKLARLRSWTENQKLAVTDESVRDTVLDAINYLVLFEAYRNEG